MNEYKELLKLNIKNVYLTGIATKILQHMDRIRNSNDISQARRWIMELIQNRFRVVQFKSHSNYYENIWHRAWLIMASLIPNKDIYDIFFKLYADDIPEYAPMQSTNVINPKFFRNTIAGILDIATKYIKETGTIQNLKNSPIFEKDLDYSGVYS